jgi:hypothetical protein
MPSLVSQPSPQTFPIHPLLNVTTHYSTTHIVNKYTYTINNSKLHPQISNLAARLIFTKLTFERPIFLLRGANTQYFSSLPPLPQLLSPVIYPQVSKHHPRPNTSTVTAKLQLHMTIALRCSSTIYVASTLTFNLSMPNNSLDAVPRSSIIITESAIHNLCSTATYLCCSKTRAMKLESTGFR